MKASQKTYSLKKGDIQEKWYLVDAAGVTLGRLASKVAALVRGKERVAYTPSMPMGDFVVVINAEKIKVTGKKETDKIYYRHSGYPGGLKAENLGDLRNRRPEQVILNAVKGMIPHNRLGRQLITRVKVYAGESHPHEAQQVIPIPSDQLN